MPVHKVWLDERGVPYLSTRNEARETLQTLSRCATEAGMVMRGLNLALNGDEAVGIRSMIVFAAEAEQ